MQPIPGLLREPTLPCRDQLHAAAVVNGLRHSRAYIGVKPMGDDPMASLGLEGALKHNLYYYIMG